LVPRTYFALDRQGGENFCLLLTGAADHLNCVTTGACTAAGIETVGVASLPTGFVKGIVAAPDLSHMRIIQVGNHLFPQDQLFVKFSCLHRWFPPKNILDIHSL
jgi:hypothetical protein